MRHITIAPQDEFIPIHCDNTEENSTEVAETPSRYSAGHMCSICNNAHNTVPFKNGYICENCIQDVFSKG